MAYVAPITRSTGDLITAAIWNQEVVDNPIALKAAVDAAAQIIASYDTNGSYSTTGTTPAVIDGTNLTWTITPTTTTLYISLFGRITLDSAVTSYIGYRIGGTSVTEKVVQVLATSSESIAVGFEATVTAGATITLALDWRSNTTATLTIEDLLCVIQQA